MAVISLFILAGATACGTEGPKDPPTPLATPSTTMASVAPTAPAPPVAPDLMLQVRTGAGYFEDAFTIIPEFTLYADGRVIRPGPRSAVHPAPALRPLLLGRLGDAEVRSAAAAAREAGLAGSPDVGDPTITDQSTTRFVLVEKAKTSLLNVYALNVREDELLGLSRTQLDNRRRLKDLARRLSELAAPAQEPFAAAAVSVLVVPRRPDAGPAARQAVWPLGDLAAGGTKQLWGRCLGFSGTESAQVLAAAAGAMSDTQWHSGGASWSLSFRPELPGDIPCRPVSVPR